MIIFTDASAHGWGAISWNSWTGSVKHRAAPWPSDAPLWFRNTSSYTEMEAIRIAVASMSSVSSIPTNILVVTDSEAAAHACRAGYSPAWPMNGALRIMAKYPGVRWQVAWADGESNFADAGSRGKSPIEVNVHDIRCRVGKATGWIRSRA